MLQRYYFFKHKTLYFAGGFIALGAVLCILPTFIARQEGRAPKFQPDVNHEIEVMDSMMPVDDYSMKGCQKEKV